MMLSKALLLSAAALLQIPSAVTCTKVLRGTVYSEIDCQGNVTLDYTERYHHDWCFNTPGYSFSDVILNSTVAPYCNDIMAVTWNTGNCTGISRVWYRPEGCVSFPFVSFQLFCMGDWLHMIVSLFGPNDEDAYGGYGLYLFWDEAQLSHGCGDVNFHS